jgi:hypothetical protein
MRTGIGTSLGYQDHNVVDGGNARIILAALVTSADVLGNEGRQRDGDRLVEAAGFGGAERGNAPGC